MTDFFPQIARFVTSSFDPTVEACEVMQLSLLDWMACGRSGATEPVAVAARAAGMVLTSGDQGAVVFGSPQRFPAGFAALINGATSHALDYDDTHFAHIGHPSVVILSAVMAIAAGRPTTEVIKASLIGAEVSVRAGVWLGRSHYQAGFHQTATAGAFGATAAVGYILGLTEAQMGDAFGLVASRSGGLKAQFGTMAKPMNAGFAAQAGVEAALLVAHGVAANPVAADEFAGRYAGERDLSALDGLGHAWRMIEVSHKFHACCHGLHAALEALGTLDISDVAAISLRTHSRWRSVCNQPSPTTGLGAKFSYTTVLCMAANGIDTARMDSYGEPFVLSPECIAIRDCVTVVFDDNMSETAAEVIVTRADGAKLTAKHDLLAPQAMTLRRAKVRAKTAALLGPDIADQIWDVIVAGANPGDMARLMS